MATGMTCPVCGGATGVQGTFSECDFIVRRRKCKECGRAFVTTEMEMPDSVDDYYRLARERDQRRRAAGITKT